MIASILFIAFAVLLIVGAPEHPSEWFPAVELIQVEQADGANIML